MCASDGALPLLDTPYMDVITRRAINPAGEELVAVIPMDERFVRLSAFREFSGLRDEEIVLSRFATVPVPFYPAEWEPGLRRWLSVKPEAMWHPLMWLDDELATRYVTDDEAPDLFSYTPAGAETDDMWALRVMLEMKQRGLFDPETGEWVDVLSLVGIDIDTPAGLNRVKSWLDGGTDAALDTLELPPVLPETAEITGDDDWAWIKAQSAGRTLVIMQIATDSEDMAEGLGTMVQEWVDGTEGAIQVPAGITNLLYLATMAFHPLGATEHEWWSTLYRWAAAELFPLDGVEAADGDLYERANDLILSENVDQALIRLEQLSAVYTAEADRIASGD